MTKTAILAQTPPARHIDRPDGFSLVVHAVDFEAGRNMPDYIVEKFKKFKGDPTAEVPFYWASLVADLPVKELENAVGNGTLAARLPNRYRDGDRARLLGTYASSGFIIAPDPNAKPNAYCDTSFNRNYVTDVITDSTESKTSMPLPGSPQTEVVGVFHNPTKSSRAGYAEKALQRANTLREIVEEQIGTVLPIKEIRPVK